MTLILDVCTIAGGVVAFFAIAAALTKRGRTAYRRFGAFIARRPRVPRTKVHLEPDRQFCFWSQVPNPKGGDSYHVGIEWHGVATNLTPGHKLRLTDLQLDGVKGLVAWNAINSADPRASMIAGAQLTPLDPVELAFIAVVERDALPGGDLRARFTVTDNFGGRHKTPRMAYKYLPSTQKPASPAPQPDLLNPLNRPPSALPPKLPANRRPQKGGRSGP